MIARWCAPLVEGETHVQVLWFRVRGLLPCHLDLDQRPGRRPRLAEISHIGDGFAGRGVLRLWRRTCENSGEKLGIAVNPAPTQGPVHNVKLVDGGGAQLGMITMGVGLQGWNGTGDWTGGTRFRNMRALFPMYDTPFHAVALQRSGIATFAQLKRSASASGRRRAPAALMFQQY